MATYLQADGVKARVVRRCFWLLWADGFTLGSWTFYRSSKPSPYLLAHEFAHVISYGLIGFWPFLWNYVTSSSFRRFEEAAAHAYGVTNAYRDPFMRAAKMWGWTP